MSKDDLFLSCGIGTVYADYHILGDRCLDQTKGTVVNNGDTVYAYVIIPLENGIKSLGIYRICSTNYGEAE